MPIKQFRIINKGKGPLIITASNLQEVTPFPDGLTSHPLNPIEGVRYFNTVDKTEYIYAPGNINSDAQGWLDLGYIPVNAPDATFLANIDTPNSYVGQANKLVRVSGGETSLEFIDPTFTHIQINNQSTWVVNHNLNKYPSVTIVDSGNNVVIADIAYSSKTQLTITFTSASSGKAFLN